MNLVYKHAALIIIAAIGEDATAGLCGLRPRKTSMQHSIRLGSVRLVATMDPVVDIAASPWNSRGWTFQEGILSNRRLVFGPRQVYFQCQAMHCLESLKVPLDLMPVSDEPGFLSRPNFGKFFPNIGIANGLDAFNERLRDYLTKSLSYESDILNAFNGILKEFEIESSGMQLFSFVGLPISPGRRDMTKWLLQIMYWPASLEGVQRRKSFPSWSWAGWTRPTETKFQAQFDTQLQLVADHNMCNVPLVKVKIDLGRYGVFDWEQFWWEIIQASHYESRHLRLMVEGWFLDFKVDKHGSLFHDCSEQQFIQTLLSRILSDAATTNSILHRIQMISSPIREAEGKYHFSWVFILGDSTATFAETFVLAECYNGSHECVVRRSEACPVVRPIMMGSELPHPFRYNTIWLG